MNFSQSWNKISYSNLKCPFYYQLIIFWIEILIFGFKNNVLEFKYQFLDQIFFFEFKYKISYSN